MRTSSSHPAAAEIARPPFEQFLAQTESQPVYVILGVQGSGTNLLGRMLTRLFNFSVVRDRSSVFNAAARLGRTPAAADVRREMRRFVSLVAPSELRRKSSKYVIRRNDPFRGIDEAFASANIRTGADFARFVYAYRAWSVRASHLAIKSDDLWESIDAIDDVLPNRRVILLTRDFRDNLLSVSGKQFGPIEPVCAAGYVKRQLACYAAEYRRAGGQGLHVKFETLLTSPIAFVEEFSKHFGIAPADQAAIAALQFRPNKMGKWKALPPRQLAWCEGILADELREFGYAIESDQPAVPDSGQLLFANVKDGIRRVPQKIGRLLKRVRG